MALTVFFSFVIKRCTLEIAVSIQLKVSLVSFSSFSASFDLEPEFSLFALSMASSVADPPT